MTFPWNAQKNHEDNSNETSLDQSQPSLTSPPMPTLTKDIK